MLVLNCFETFLSFFGWKILLIYIYMYYRNGSLSNGLISGCRSCTVRMRPDDDFCGLWQSLEADMPAARLFAATCGVVQFQKIPRTAKNKASKLKLFLDSEMISGCLMWPYFLTDGHLVVIFKCVVRYWWLIFILFKQDWSVSNYSSDLIDNGWAECHGCVQSSPQPWISNNSVTQ